MRIAIGLSGLGLAGCFVTEGLGQTPVDLDGNWSLDRSLVTAEPVAPRTAACTEGFTTGNQPSRMTISGDLVGTDYGSTLNHVVVHDGHVSFDALEYWNTIGWNEQHPVYYEFEQQTEDTLSGTVTARPPWPDGTCAYTFIIASERQ